MKLLVNNKELDLGQESIKIELNSNIFSDSFVTPNFTYPFSLPLTANNLLALGLVNNLDSVGVNNTYDVEVYDLGMLFLSGKLLITGSNESSIKCTVQVALASKRNELLKTKIADLTSSIYNFIIDNPSGWWNLLGSPAADYNFVGYAGDKFSFNLYLQEGSADYGPYFYHSKYDSSRGPYGLVYDFAYSLMHPVFPTRVADPSTFQHVLDNVYVWDDNGFGDKYYEAGQNGTLNLNIEPDTGNEYNLFGDLAEWIEIQRYGSNNSFWKYATPDAPTHLIGLPVPKKNGFAASIIIIDPTNGTPNHVNSFLSFQNPPFYTNFPNGNSIQLFNDDFNVSPDLDYRNYVSQVILFDCITSDFKELIPEGTFNFINERPYAFFPIKCPNAVDTSESGITFPNFKGFLNYNGRHEAKYITVLPYIKYIFEGILNQIDIALSAESLFSDTCTSPIATDFKQLVFFNNFLNDYIADNYYYPKTTVDVTQFLPDITLDEFLNTFRKYFFLSIQCSNDLSSISIKPIKEILDSKTTATSIDDYLLSISEVTLPANKGFTVSFTKDDAEVLNAEIARDVKKGVPDGIVEDIADLITTNAKIGAIYLVTSLNDLYINWGDYSNPDSWRFYSHNKLNWIIGDGTKPYTADSDYCFMYKGDDSVLHEDLEEATRSWLVPFTKLPMKSLFLGTGTDCKLRFLFDRDLQPDSNGDLYRLGSTGKVNYAGEQVGNLDLYLQGPGSLGEVYGSPYFDLLDNSKVVKMKLRCDAAILYKLTFDNLIRFKGNYYLISKLSYSLPLKDLVDIEAYQVQ